MPSDKPRYAISFTPAPHEALGIVGANWVGRNAYSGQPIEPPMIGGMSLSEIAFHTALPRRYGFQGMLKSPFHLAEGTSEALLLNALMRFATGWKPFFLPPLKVVRRRDSLAFAPAVAVPALDDLAAAVVSEFDPFRAPLSEAELERRDTGSLSPVQFANLHRWGEPDVLTAFSFHMPLTGPLRPRDMERMERAALEFFGPILAEPVEFENIALFVEEEPGAPFCVHSLHPMGALPARRTA
ncbi:DUF1045 domain-containing protein [Martelella sp. AD-3]|uniref:DUF1045 domain-containing protein n=1 Tax=Martelella sp. AD-3 TaxID=686597 RepID=UPI000462E871|nr:DUF1045 domain-containing protein [Martelella sp. AD-3]AMM83594.1 hypothetical protein AZF01_03835 [Martelella sp. AD-3]MAM11621.1 DUF1045 domain-containing protein [Rhizobiaceae bacterium]